MKLDVLRNATRSKLLNVSADLFLEKGFDGCSMSDIAEAAKVSKGTLYNHFPDKGALFVEAVSGKATAGDRLAFDFISAHDLRDSLVLLARQLAETALSAEEQNVELIIRLETRRFPDLSSTLVYRHKRIIEAVAGFLQNEVIRGGLFVDDIVVASKQFIALCASALPSDGRIGKQGVLSGMSNPLLLEAIKTFLYRYAVSNRID